ncbi:ribosome hibernation-promoting factor, HPF/YfiA family [Rhodothermus bifroesti]|jgi:ribosomal subunit interface protein|uniref:Ribosome-associated translation inhibitor RaiA n=1 Tax=Rhodothermus marinus TaxID=29549 RepID=A0A7V2F7C8_RHOMR|nr:ribosome-associated translation inhibitor RaiA [Rhodothermus bifroesti]GBD00517.1 hypothetical protein HRbin18_00226 [bacterium HR18]
METPNIAFEYYSENHELTDALKAKVEQRIYKLAKKNRDITGVSVAVQQAERSQTPHAYRVRVVVYHRPENIAAVEVAPSVQEALLSALDSIERQVREHRRKLREQWKRS